MSGIGASTSTVSWIAGGAIAVAVAGGVVWTMSRSAPDPEVPKLPVVETAQPAVPAQNTAPTTETSTAEPTVDATANEAETVTDTIEADAEKTVETAAMAAPRFDVFLAQGNGTSLVAGAADPGATVEILLDGDKLIEAETDGTGKFAQFVTIEPSTAPRVLTLLARKGDETVAGREQMIVAPIEIEVADVADTPAVSETARVENDTTPTVEQPEPSNDQPTLAEQAVDALVQPAEELETVAADQIAEPAADTTDPAPTVLLANEQGVEVLTQGPSVLSNIALDSITYDPSGEVALAGRGIGEGAVRVYLNNKPVSEAVIVDGGNWRTDLPNIDTGVYTLRVDEVDAQGAVVSRVETPFKREEPKVVEAILAEETAQEGFEIAVKTVQPGATLWAIAREKYGDGILYVKVFEANRDLIRDPDLIYPGQILALPSE